MNPIDVILVGTHLLFLLAAALTAGLSWKMVRLGHLAERRTLIIACTQAAVCAVAPAMYIVTGRAPSALLTGVVFIVVAVTAWVWWTRRHTIALVLLRPPASCAPGELLVMRGVPGCGKSTLAKRWVAIDPTRRARVNRDDTRLMMHGGWIGKLTEAIVSAGSRAMVEALLRAGVSVVVDDTNLEARHVETFGRIALAAGARIHIIDLRRIALEQCLAQNARRSGSARLPDETILRLYQDYVAGAQIPAPQWSSTIVTSPDAWIASLN